VRIQRDHDQCSSPESRDPSPDYPSYTTFVSREPPPEVTSYVRQPNCDDVDERSNYAAINGVVPSLAPAALNDYRYDQGFRVTTCLENLEITVNFYRCERNVMISVKIMQMS